MWLVVIIILAVVPCQCWASTVIYTSEQPEHSYLIEETVQILSSCYASQIDTVGLSGNTDPILIKALQSRTSFAVTLLDPTRRSLDKAKDPIRRKRRHKLQVAVVTTSSLKELEEVLQSMRTSPWWNHMAYVLIVVRPTTTQDGCSKAGEMLWFAWKNDLLNTKLLCLISSTQERLVYTYNPYSRLSPDVWQVVDTLKGKNGHPWTLLVLRYQDTEGETCRELDWDKTRDLAGYEIRASFRTNPGYFTVNPNKTGRDRLGSKLGRIARFLFDALNATPKMMVYHGLPAFNDPSGRDIIMDVADGISEIFLNLRYAIDKENLTATYPHLYSRWGVVTNYRGQMSQLDKIMSVVDTASHRGICLVVMMTLLYFVFFLKQSLVPAMLNIFRIICGGSMHNVPKSLAARFYLGSLFAFFLTFQAIYQGKLAALLSKPVLLPNVDTMKELIDSSYTIYAYSSAKNYLNMTIFQRRHVQLDRFDCTPEVSNDPMAACVSVYYWLIEEANARSLYLSRNAIIELPVSYVVKSNWPLEARVNRIMMAMFEAKVIWYEYDRGFELAREIREFWLKEAENQRFDVIRLDELSFVFAILGIGLTCAGLCFILENVFALTSINFIFASKK